MIPSNLPRPLLPPRLLPLLVLLALTAAGLGIYAQTLGYPFISFDDPGYVYGNPHVARGLSWEGWHWAWTSFERANWHPLTWLSLMLDAQVYGLNAGGYHLTNLLLHLANAALLFTWLRRATGALWPSALTAFFFVAHPLHVESVAWVTERKDVLSTFFFCLALLAYTRYARGAGRESRRAYAAALGCFALGLTAKPMLVTLPPLLLLLDCWPLRRTAGWRRLVWEKLPFFALAAASCLVTVLAQRREALVPLASLPVPQRLASAALGCGTYLIKTFWPTDLGIYYPYWQGRSGWAVAGWAGALLGLSAGAWALRRTLPWVAVGWAWFLGTLVPVVGVVQVGGQAVADRYTYLPHVGLFIALFWTGAALWAARRAARPWLGGAAALAAAACLLLAHRQAGYWRGSAALFAHTAQVARPSARLFHLLGDALLEDGRPAEAERAYERACALGPQDQEAASRLAALWLRQGRWRETAALLERWRGHPQATAAVLGNLAFALARLGRPDEAIALYRLCAARHPGYALAHFGLADVFTAQGRGPEADAEDEAGLAFGDWLPSLLRLAGRDARRADPAARARGLELARRAAAAGGRNLACLDTLALASAASGQWDAAEGAAREAVALAGQPGVPAAILAGSRARLEDFRQRRLPEEVPSPEPPVPGKGQE